MTKLRTGLARRPYVLWVVAALLAAVGVLGLWKAHDLRSTPAAQNDAIVDASGTADIQAIVSQSLTKVLTYDWSNPDATTAAADEVLTGKARTEYDTLFADLHAKAPEQQLTLTATVQSVAVKNLDEDSADVLVFLDQTSQRASDGQASLAAAQIAVTVEKSGSTWKITELTPL